MTTQTNIKRPPSKTFEELIVWQKAHQFVLAVYGLTQRFPHKEIYGLTSQFRRAAMSVPANISEGYKKSGRMDKLRFLNTAQGSLEECRYYLILTRDLQYGDIAPLQPILEETSKLLEAYSGAIRRRVIANVSGIVLTFAGLLATLHWLL
jgi:four helix bundle protein